MIRLSALFTQMWHGLRRAQARHVYIHKNIIEWTGYSTLHITQTYAPLLAGMTPGVHDWDDEFPPTINYCWTRRQNVAELVLGYVLNLDGETARRWSPQTPVLVVYNELTHVWHFGVFGAEKGSFGSIPASNHVNAQYAGVWSPGPLDAHALAG
jgi:hypothetical protein